MSKFDIPFEQNNSDPLGKFCIFQRMPNSGDSPHSLTWISLPHRLLKDVESDPVFTVHPFPEEPRDP